MMNRIGVTCGVALAIGALAWPARPVSAAGCQFGSSLPVRAVIATWYGIEHRGVRTSIGEAFDERLLTAAHPWLPLRSLIRVTNLLNGRSLIVRITDRMPVSGIGLDLSEAAARLLGMRACGRAPVVIAQE
jgi:rare lipoprotein A (peptidoglycan hydrolase)